MTTQLAWAHWQTRGGGDLYMLVCVWGLVLGVGLMGGSEVRAQADREVSISASARPAEVGTAGTVTFEIEVRGVPLSAIDIPDPPSTVNLVLQESTPVTRRELSFDSGRLTRRLTFAWRYRPMRIGIGRIRPTTLQIEGERYKTDEVRVRIVSQSQRARSTPPHGPNASSSRSASARLPGPRDLFIRATASADTVYQNEQVTAEYRLFFRPGVRLQKSRMADAWDASGFWREELDVDSRPTPEETTLNGQTYKTIMLKRVVLFPARPGRLTVSPLEIETEARARPQLGQQGELPRSQYQPVTLSSDTLVIHARPLPPDAPPAFNGAVGQFALNTTVQPESVEVGSAVDLTARIEGAGNIATVSPPRVTPPAAFDLYDPNLKTSIDRSGTRLRGAKTFSYVLVPRTPGTHTLPPVEFAYFDPEAGQYEVLRSGKTTFRVTGKAQAKAQNQTASGLPIGEIAGPMDKEPKWVRVERTPLYAQPWAYVVLLLPVVLAAGGVAYRRRGHVQQAEPASSADRYPDASRHLQTARTHLRGKDRRAFYEAVEQALLTFLSGRIDDLPRPASRMAAADLARHLARHDIPAASREALRELLDTCNQVQFGPGRPSADAMGEHLERTRALLQALDEQLPDVPPDAAPAR